MNRFGIGRFLREIMEDLKYCNNSPTRTIDEPKLLIYSGHDTTLLPVMCALNIYDGNWPPYASYVTLEFVKSKINNKKYVRAIFNDQEMKIFNQEHIYCPIDLFYERFNKLSLTQEEYLRDMIIDLTVTEKLSPESAKELRESIEDLHQDTQATLGDTK